MIDRDLCMFLKSKGISFTLIGAVALAVHGVARFTADVDLLTSDPTVLSPGFWTDFRGAQPELRTGDAEDPLMGVARLPLSPQHDLIVTGSPGARLALDQVATVEGLPCLVASPLALLALKAEAGAPQDAHDARALLEAQALLGDPGLAQRFREILPQLGKEAIRFTERFQLLEGLP